LRVFENGFMTRYLTQGVKVTILSTQKDEKIMKSRWIGILLGSVGAAMAVAQEANAHLCEGTFTVTNVASGLYQGTNTSNSAGEVNGIPCPKHLYVELVSLPGDRRVLASITTDGSPLDPTPSQLIHQALDREKESGYGEGVYNGAILATDFQDREITGNLTAVGGWSRAVTGVILFTRAKGSNSVQCDEDGLNWEAKYQDGSSRYDLKCTYERDRR
jgi:hypothetical protein